MKPPKWNRNTYKEEVYFFDGDEIAVAIKCTREDSSHEFWKVFLVTVNCDHDRFDLLHSETLESFDNYDWFDVGFFMRLDSVGPMTKKQMEKFE